MTSSERVLVAAALADDGKGSTSEIAELLGVTHNNVALNASRLRAAGYIKATRNDGVITPTVAGLRKAVRILGVS